MSKHMLLGKIKEAMQTKTEAGGNKYVLMATTILTCKGWEKKNKDGEDVEFASSESEQKAHFMKSSIPLPVMGNECYPPSKPKGKEALQCQSIEEQAGGVN